MSCRITATNNLTMIKPYIHVIEAEACLPYQGALKEVFSPFVLNGPRISGLG